MRGTAYGIYTLYILFVLTIKRSLPTRPKISSFKMSNIDKVQKALEEHSSANIDEYIHTSSFDNKAEDVSMEFGGETASLQH